jgi:hypothetical protein
LDIPTEAAIGISAGIVAVIVIGAVVCIALTSIAGKKGFDVWLRNHKQIEGAQVNPLYNDDGLSGANPMAV